MAFRFAFNDDDDNDDEMSGSGGGGGPLSLSLVSGCAVAGVVGDDVFCSATPAEVVVMVVVAVVFLSVLGCVYNNINRVER